MPSFHAAASSSADLHRSTATAARSSGFIAENNSAPLMLRLAQKIARILTCLNFQKAQKISLAAAINNCLQTMTFFLVVLLRMEKLKLRTIGGVAKVVGIMLCMGGEATLAFYKGPYLKPFLHNYHPFDSNNNSSQQGHDNSPGENWIKGCFLMFLSNLCWALWIVYQESSLPDIFTANSWVSPNAMTRSRSNGKASPDGMVMSTILKMSTILSFGFVVNC